MTNTTGEMTNTPGKDEPIITRDDVFDLMRFLGRITEALEDIRNYLVDLAEDSWKQRLGS